MTNLEQKIYAELTSYHDREKVAKKIAKIALELAEKAYYEGRYAGREEVYYNYQFGDSKTFKQFIEDYE